MASLLRWASAAVGMACRLCEARACASCDRGRQAHHQHADEHGLRPQQGGPRPGLLPAAVLRQHRPQPRDGQGLQRLALRAPRLPRQVAQVQAAPGRAAAGVPDHAHPACAPDPVMTSQGSPFLALCREHLAPAGCWQDGARPAEYLMPCPTHRLILRTLHVSQAQPQLAQL